MHQIQHQSAAATAVAKNRYAILAIVLAGSLMSVLDALVVNVALPTITTYYDAGISGTQWVVTAYLMTMTCLLLPFGKASEFTGKARMFTAGAALFTVSSLACGLSGSLAAMVAFRILQAIGGAMMFSISTAIVFQAFPAELRGRALGLLAAVTALGSILGPSLGGFIVDIVGWQYVFYVNLPIGIALVLAALKYLRLDETHSQRLEMDWIGSAAFALATVSLLEALGGIAAGVTATTVMWTAGFIAGAAAFLWAESRARTRLLDLSLFSSPQFLLPLTCTLLFYMAHVAVNIAGPFFYQGVMGYSASQVGLLYVVVFAAMVVTAPVSGWLYDRYHSRYHSATGIGVVALSVALLGFAFLEKDLLLIVAALVLDGVGGGLFQAPNNVEVMSAVKGEKLGMASSAIATARNFAMALGASFVGLLLTVQLGTGNMAGVPADTLANASSAAMFVLACLCATGIVLSLLRNVTSR